MSQHMEYTESSHERSGSSSGGAEKQHVLSIHTGH
jgi:hypothetical protein